MKKITKIMAILLALLMVIPTLAACKNEGETTQASEGTNEPGTDATAEPSGDAKEYTYRLTMSDTPSTWNPHTWEMNNESEMMAYIEGMPVDVSMDSNGLYMWVYEMLTNVTDVTNTWEEAANWLPEDFEAGTVGYIYQLDLNPDAKWEDGTPINADDYIYSMQQLLSSEMKNYRAGNYIEGSSAVKNAKAYYMNDQAGLGLYGDATADDGYIKDAEAYYINPDEACIFFGDATSSYYEGGYDEYFMDGETDLYQALWGRDAIDKTGMIQITEDDIENLLKVAANFGDTNPEAWYEFCFVQIGTREATPWESVGLVKGDDYTIYYVLETPETMFYFLTAMTSGWLVNEELYEAGKTTTGDLVTTDYGTDVDNYSATGPYRVEAFEPSKSFTLVKNENWYGWTDGKHEGQYQTTKIVYEIVSEHATEVMLFKQGKLDEISLTSDDMDEFRASDNLLKTDQTYTYRWIFATDVDSLKALETEAGDGANKAILAYDDFRLGISLSIDRAYLCQTCTPGYKPAYYLFNSLYYYDVENNPDSVYRNSDAGMAAVCNIYDVTYGEGGEYATLEEAYASITGYDVAAAKEHFQAAAAAAIADGNYTAGQAINITCQATALQSLSTDYVNECEYLNNAINTALEGTDLGTVTITYLANCSNRYEEVATGKVEMARGAWGGAAFYLQNAIRCYTDPEYTGGYVHENCGFDPTRETVEIEINGVKETKTYKEWSDSVNGVGENATDMDRKLAVIAGLEEALVKGAHMIPFACDTVVGMFSFKISYATLEYDIMYGYGGIRLMTYNYDDAAWEEFVSSNGGELDYT